MEKAKEKLTKQQRHVLDYVKQYIANHNYPPAIREICQGMGLKSSATVYVHLDKLENKGYIRKDNNKNRAIELLVDNEYVNNNEDIVKVPLLGMVAAGNPIEVIERPNEFFSLPTYLVPEKKEVFTLEVTGDSMINAGIYNNDIVIVEKSSQVKNGDKVVAMTDDNDVTLKTFYKENGYIRLQPENDLLKPIILNNVTILGKAIGLYRKF